MSRTSLSTSGKAVNTRKEHIFAATHTHSLKSVMEKTITLGKLEGSVKVHITIYIYYSMVFISEFVWSLGILSCVFRLFELPTSYGRRRKAKANKLEL